MTAQLDIGTAVRADLRLNSSLVAALQSGPMDGPPVLLLPGYTGSKEDFGPLLDPLGARGYRVTAIDLPGQFESPGPTESADYRPDALGAVVLDAAAHLGPDVHLLGHSFGGLVARAAVLAEPEQFADLVLLSSGPAQLGGGRRRSMDHLEPVLAAAGLPGVYAALQTAARADAGYVAPSAELAAFLERRFLAGSPQMLQGMGDALRHEPDRTAELASTGVPVLVAHGAGDDAWPPATQQEMAARLGARYAVIDGAAHSAAVESPAATAEVLLDFWA